MIVYVAVSVVGIIIIYHRYDITLVRNNFH